MAAASSRPNGSTTDPPPPLGSLAPPCASNGLAVSALALNSAE
eukprot:CAMPEP_0182552584 /NCGR_PEP_ID=MMETSP1323-20130603/48838_1 /TAXON_ID=236787 /ORGANISM="Florenciella parvula, Strain RCC1693" /LENGTH=42 /DNA_ID= /DNA_START= /DNA_END= /DNA_ORIENTATION=